MTTDPKVTRVRVCVRHKSVEVDKGAKHCEGIWYAMGEFALKGHPCRFRWFYLPDSGKETM